MPNTSTDSLFILCVTLVTMPVIRCPTGNAAEAVSSQLLSRGYKASDLRLAVEYGKGLDREKSLEKVEREETNQGRVRYTIT